MTVAVRTFVVASLAVLVLAGPTAAQVMPPAGLVPPTAAAVSDPPAPTAPASDSAPSYNDYFEALGYSFSRGLFTSEQAPPLAIGSAAALALWPVDERVSRAVRGRVGGLGKAGDIIGSPMVMGGLSAGLMVASLGSDDTRFRTYAFALSQGLIVAGSLTAATKLATRRTRPNGSNRRSFPSGHAAATFALATVSSHYYGRKAAIPLYALAGAVAFSRVMSGNHYPSDAVAGATIGYLAGRAAILAAQHVSVGSPSEGGVSISFVF